MFDHTHYVPILRGKQGELSALNELSSLAAASMTPLIETPSLPADADEMEQALRNMLARVHRGWGTDRRFFLDVPSSPTIAAPVLEFVFEQARRAALIAVPVIRLTDEDFYRLTIAEIAASDGRGVCVRLDPSDFITRVGPIDERLAELLERLCVTYDEIDLLVDFGKIGHSEAGTVMLAAEDIFRRLPTISRWRTLSVAASSFPDVSSFGPNTTTAAPRIERALFERLRAVGVPRMPTFADYGITGPQRATSTTSQYAPSPNLRYTLDEDYLVFKARAPRYGNDQFFELCAKLVASREFAGDTFSWGDAQIRRAARRAGGPGSAWKWIQIGTNHHLEAVVRQVATLAP